MLILCHKSNQPLTESYILFKSCFTSSPSFFISLCASDCGFGGAFSCFMGFYVTLSVKIMFCFSLIKLDIFKKMAAMPYLPDYRHLTVFLERCISLPYDHL